MNQNVEQKLSLISEGLSEIIDLDTIETKMKNFESITAYWGTEPTRSPSLGYLIPMIKIRDLIKADINTIIFLADVHAFLNKGLENIDRTEHKVNYYKFLIEKILNRLGVEKHEYTFILGSEVQLKPKYTLDLLRFMTVNTISTAKKAGSEVVKQNKDPKVSSIIYPMMQVIDEMVLGADIQLGGVDQRKIFMLSRDQSEKINKPKCSYLINQLLPNLKKPKLKMNSSDASKIDFFDDEKAITEKILDAYCIEHDDEIGKNPLLILVKYIIFPILNRFMIYQNYDSFIKDWKDQKFFVKEFKLECAKCVNEILLPIRKELEAVENKHLFDKAFGEAV